MILLDTHMWIWWVSASLRPQLLGLIGANIADGIGISIMSCWEIAKKVQANRLDLDQDVATWLTTALGYPGVQLVGLSPEIVIDATSLPGQFHKDPADQLIVATARVLDVPLLTADAKIIAYPHVRKAAIPDR